MNLIIAIYIVMTIIMFVIWLFSEYDDEDFIKIVILWPIWIIKILVKELFKLLFTDWK